jgi:hypothetical protein
MGKAQVMWNYVNDDTPIPGVHFILHDGIALLPVKNQLGCQQGRCSANAAR